MVTFRFRMFCFDFRGLSPGHVGCFVVVVIGHCPATSDCFCYGGCEPPSGHVGDCYGRGRHPRGIGAGRSTSVRTLFVTPGSATLPVRCRTVFAHMLKRPGPPAPAPKELAILPPWPASAKTDRHRQKYSLWFKAPSAVPPRPAVPLGSNGCLPFPHSRGSASPSVTCSPRC